MPLDLKKLEFVDDIQNVLVTILEAKELGGIDALSDDMQFPHVTHPLRVERHRSRVCI